VFPTTSSEIGTASDIDYNMKAPSLDITNTMTNPPDTNGRNSASHLANPEQSFAQFRRLPKELRSLVWEEAAEQLPPAVHFMSLKPVSENIFQEPHLVMSALLEEYRLNLSDDAQSTVRVVSKYELFSRLKLREMLDTSNPYAQRAPAPNLRNRNLQYYDQNNVQYRTRETAPRGDTGKYGSAALGGYKNLKSSCAESGRELDHFSVRNLAHGKGWLKIDDRRSARMTTDVVCLQFHRPSEHSHRTPYEWFSYRQATNPEWGCFASVFPAFRHLKRLCFQIPTRADPNEFYDPHRYRPRYQLVRWLMSTSSMGSVSALRLHFPSLEQLLFLIDDAPTVTDERMLDQVDPEAELFPGASHHDFDFLSVSETELYRLGRLAWRTSTYWTQSRVRVSPFYDFSVHLGLGSRYHAPFVDSFSSLYDDESWKFSNQQHVNIHQPGFKQRSMIPRGPDGEVVIAAPYPYVMTTREALENDHKDLKEQITKLKDGPDNSDAKPKRDIVRAQRKLSSVEYIRFALKIHDKMGAYWKPEIRYLIRVDRKAWEERKKR